MSRKQEILDRLDLDLPVVASPMFIVSGPGLVTSASNAGILGTFPALNQRSTEGFDEWCQQINDELGGKAYGVNLIVHRTNPRVEADLRICVKNKVPIIITSLGAVKEVVQAVHSYGGLVFHDVTNSYHAQKAIDAGVDGLVLVAAGAGGHGGTLNPMPFVHEIRDMYDGLILLAGCISNGRDIASTMQMGADLAYMGTRFINTHEARAPEDYKKMIVDSGTKDIVYTAAISGIKGNYMKASLESAGIPEEMWSSEAKIELGKKLDSEAKAWVDTWSAGQGVASIKDSLATADLVARLKEEYRAALSEQSERLSKL